MMSPDLPHAAYLALVAGSRFESLDVSAAPYQWIFRFERAITLNVESFWRVIEAGRVLVTSMDEGQLFGLAQPVDAGQRCRDALGTSEVQSAVYDSVTGDLTLGFSDELRLEAIVTSSGYESWTLSDGRGNVLVGCGGGEVAIWRSSP